MAQRFQFSVRELAICTCLVCIGLVASQRCFAVRDNLLYLEVCLMAAGASFGGSTGLLFGRPIRGAVVGLIAVPIVATAVIFAVVAWVVGHMRW